MGEMYSLVNKKKVKFPQTKMVLCGVLRRTDVSWRRFGALNNRYDWTAKTLGVTFVDPNSWLEDWDFARDGTYKPLRSHTTKPAILQSWWTRRQRKEDGLTSDAERFQ